MFAGAKSLAQQRRLKLGDPNGKPFNPDRKLIAWNGTAWGGADVPDYKAD